MVIPSSIVDSMGPSGVMSVAALARQQQRQAADDEAADAPRLPPGDDDFG